ncbi:hypothetical protein CLPUN_50830 [Clostridium puniceum]|uniref:DUF6673 domain-containing protein n=1 Tax=Clostridium puniceum TaxID=29367 RepID=A0A1S8T0E8_9CLOT|nr:DUF6673 family protein [Clostridium puniceum]OOM71091.1 hypothetical protein CLPUN_50830 [Clostridium puniceum]
MIINNVEIGELDIFDADSSEKYEKTIDKVIKEAQDSKGLKLSAAIRKQCNAVFNCFNELFGEGADKKVFGDKVNLLICLKAFDELKNGISNQIEQSEIELDTIASKYTSNRAKRKVKTK